MRRHGGRQRTHGDPPCCLPCSVPPPDRRPQGRRSPPRSVAARSWAMLSARAPGWAPARRAFVGRVVVGVDGSAGSRAALAWAADEARIRGATLEVVTAWSYLD